MLALITISHCSNFSSCLCCIWVLVNDAFVSDIMLAVLFWVEDTVSVIHVLIWISIFWMVANFSWRSLLVFSVQVCWFNRSFTSTTAIIFNIRNSAWAVSFQTFLVSYNLLDFRLYVRVFSIFWPLTWGDRCYVIIGFILSSWQFFHVFRWLLIARWNRMISLSYTLFKVRMCLNWSVYT